MNSLLPFSLLFCIFDAATAQSEAVEVNALGEPTIVRVQPAQPDAVEVNALGEPTIVRVQPRAKHILDSPEKFSQNAFSWHGEHAGSRRKHVQDGHLDHGHVRHIRTDQNDNHRKLQDSVEHISHHENEHVHVAAQNAALFLPVPVLGWLMGAIIPLEPDHLCSLIALNAGEKNSWQAFRGGFKWGLGHSIGALTFCMIFLQLQSLINRQVWETYGNYVAGSLLLGIGVYFLTQESKYLEEGADGRCVPTSSACICAGCPSASSSTSTPTMCPPSTPQTQDSAASAETPPTRMQLLQSYFGDVRKFVTGILQGLCCPSCIAGLAFVGQLGAQNPVKSDITVFFGLCFASVGLTAACISAGLAALNRSLTSSYSVPTKALYRAACMMSVCLGFSWIVLNALGRLRMLEYTKSLEKSIGVDEDAVPSFIDMAPKLTKAFIQTNMRAIKAANQTYKGD